MNPITWLFGRWCTRHGVGYRSDFCPVCMKERIYRNEVMDRRRIAKSEALEGSWPLKRASGDE